MVRFSENSNQKDLEGTMSLNYKYNIIVSRFNREGKTYQIFKNLLSETVTKTDKIKKSIEESDSYNLLVVNKNKKKLIIKIDALPFVRYSYVIKDIKKNVNNIKLRNSIFFFQITNIVMAIIFSIRKDIKYIENDNNKKIKKIDVNKLNYNFFRVKKCLNRLCKIDKSKQVSLSISGNGVAFQSDYEIFKDFVELYELVNELKLYFIRYIDIICEKVDEICFILENIDRIEDQEQKRVFLSFTSMFFDVIESDKYGVKIFIENTIKSKRDFTKQFQIYYDKVFNVFNIELVSGYAQFFKNVFEFNCEILVLFEGVTKKFVLPLDVVSLVFENLKEYLDKIKLKITRCLTFLLILLYLSYNSFKTFGYDIDIYDAIYCFNDFFIKTRQGFLNLEKIPEKCKIVEISSIPQDKIKFINIKIRHDENLKQIYLDVNITTAEENYHYLIDNFNLEYFENRIIVEKYKE